MYALFWNIIFQQSRDLKFKNFPFWANYVDAYRGITKQVNSLPDSNFKKLPTVLRNYNIIKTTKGAFTYCIIADGGGGL